MFGRTVRPDVWPDFRAVAQSIMRPDIGPAVAVSRLGSRSGQGDKRDRMGQKGRAWAWTLCLCRPRAHGAECRDRHTVPGTAGRGDRNRPSGQTARTGNQERRSGETTQGKWPGTDAQTPWSEASGKRGPDGLVHVRPTSVCRGACQFLGAGLLVCTRCMLVRGASVSSSAFLALFVSFVSVFSSVFQLSRVMISPPMSRATMARMVRPHTT